MRKYRIRKKRFFLLSIILFVIGMGIGYAYLTQQLYVDNTVSYDAMKWDVGFEEVIPVLWRMDAVKPTASISSDKKTAYVNCDFGTSTSSRECVAVAMIRNDSTFKVELFTNPTITYNSALIKDVQMNWMYSYELPDGGLSDYEDQVVKGIVLAPGEMYEAVIRIISNDLTVDLLPSSVLSIPITIQLDWQQTEKEANNNNLDDYKVGNVVTIGSETFNIIDSTPSTVTMLAQKSLGSNYRQSDSPSYVNFSNNNGWEYAPGPKDVDIQQYDGPVKTYLNEYGTYLKGVTGDSSLVSDLITVRQLESLECLVQSADYSPTEGDGCKDSQYADWLINNNWWWTKTAWSSEYGFSGTVEKGVTLWVVAAYDEYMPEFSGSMFNNIGFWYDNSADLWGQQCAMGHVETCENYETWNEGHYSKTSQAVRPVITISKDKLKQYLN